MGSLQSWDSGTRVYMELSTRMPVLQATLQGALGAWNWRSLGTHPLCSAGTGRDPELAKNQHVQRHL